MEFTLPDVIWAGTQQSLILATQAHNAIQMGVYSYAPEKEEEEKSYLLSVHGDVGVVTIRGSLTNRDSYWNRYAGVTSYNEIRRALVQAANDKSLKSILLDIDSGGGAVSGVADVGNLIRAINSGVKRVYAFTDGNMCSAAYWVGCAAAEVYTSKTAVLGSIGVIATHMEYSEMFKKAGIGVNVVRAGEFKALLNTFEKAPKEGLEKQAEMLSAMYDVFVEHVAECRSSTVAQVNSRMAQGREFVGAMAVDVGLADGVSTFDKLLGTLQAKSLDSESFPFDNSDNPNRNMPMKQALTQQEIAALAAGAPSATAPAAPAAEAPAAAPAAPAAEAPAGDATLVKYLQGQVTETNAELTKTKVELATLQAQFTEMKGTHDALVKIASAAVQNMKVALGFSAIDMSKMNAMQIVAEHAATAEQFASKFKPGGVGASSAPLVDKSKDTVVDDSHRAALLAATSYK